MKLSTKGRYGLKAMFDLAQNHGEGPIALKNVSQRQGISDHYLEQLIASLKKAGLVRSIRGAQGGYTLSRKPEQITVGEVIRALEGDLAPADCVSTEDPLQCSEAGCCVTQPIWRKIRDSINKVIDSITLQDMLDDYTIKSEFINKGEKDNAKEDLSGSCCNNSSKSRSN
jgi:Rrf2 family transcriptional regulator, cysteine metabolism repressor